MVNTQILAAVLVIGASGFIRVWTGQGSQGASITRVIVGTNVLLIVLAVADFFGPPLSTIAGGIAMLAALVVILTQIPWFQLFSKLGVNTASPVSSPGHAVPANSNLSPQ